jgi:hypothetical protein
MTNISNRVNQIKKSATHEMTRLSKQYDDVGLLFLPLTVAFLIWSPSFILFIAPVEIIFMLIMIKLVEEPNTIRKFGNEYLEYKKQVPWFCFKIKCLKKLLENVP